MRNNNRINTPLVIALLVLMTVLTSCGYRMVGSTFLPFNSIYIQQVVNRTYEPRLEERMHDALSREFISQGIEMRSSSADARLEAEVVSFELGAVGAVDEVIKEQELFMAVNIKLIDSERVTEFREMRSPLRITFISTGTVSDSVTSKEAATDRACSEIAKEIVGRIIMSYAK